MIKFRLNLQHVFTAAALFAVFSVFAGYPSGILAASQEKENNTPSDAQSAADVKPIVDPSVDALLRQMGDTLKSSGELSFSVDVTFDDVLPSGQKIQYGGEARITLKRPGRVYASYKGDLHDRKIWYDGEEVTILNMKDNFYGRLKVPPTIDETMDYLINDYGFTLPLSDILYSDPYASLMSNVSAGVVVGDSGINGTECRHLAFVEKYIDWQLWVSEGTAKLPCKLVITYKTIPGAPQYTAVFSDWNMSPDVSASIFKPVLPEGAEKIDFISLNDRQGGIE